jgi:hypothetical protein
MSAFGQGKNKEYLVHVITVKGLLKQKGTFHVRKAFVFISSDVRKQLELLLKAPKEGETKAKKEEQKNLSTIKKDLNTARKLAGVDTLKAYELLHHW